MARPGSRRAMRRARGLADLEQLRTLQALNQRSLDQLDAARNAPCPACALAAPHPQPQEGAMTVITYADQNGDAVTEYPPFPSGPLRVVVEHNPTGFRLIPPGCWHGCGQPATHRVVRYGVGEAQTYTCRDHLEPDVRAYLAELNSGGNG